MKVDDRLKYFSSNGNLSIPWLGGNKVDSVFDADIVVIPDRGSISPDLYDDKPLEITKYNKTKDQLDLDIINLALEFKKPILAIGSGLHMMTVVSGGDVIQRATHPHSHDIEFYDGTLMSVESKHTQLANPYTMDEDEFDIVAVSKVSSPLTKDGNWRSIYVKDFVDPEIIYYRETNSLCLQFDPDKMYRTSTAVEVSKRLVDLLVKGELEYVLDYGVSVSRFIKKDFKLKLETI